MYRKRGTCTLSPPPRKRKRIDCKIPSAPCRTIRTVNHTDYYELGQEGLVTKIVGDGLVVETDAIYFKTNEEQIGLTELMNKIRILEQHQVNMRNQVDRLQELCREHTQTSHQLQEENMSLKEQLEMIKSWMELNKPSC